MSDTAIYPACVLSLQSFEGFYEAYLTELKYHDKYRDAYEMVERVHEHYFGKRRYAGYNVFMVMVSNRLKKET